MLSGVGLGLRSEFLSSFLHHPRKNEVNFLEVAPENWIKTNIKKKAELKKFTETYPLVCHGLSLSIGDLKPLDLKFLDQLKQFFDHYNVQIYSEHLSYCGDESGHLYDLMPLPFTQGMINYLIPRIQKVQEIIHRPLVLENVSYYLSIKPEMTEIEFLLSILNQSGALLLLDVNNVYVNSINHHYDPYEFIDQIPTEKIAYIHIAGHYRESENLIIDTHGADIIDPVWDLLSFTYQRHGIFPTLLERDFNIPELDELFLETAKIKQYQCQSELIKRGVLSCQRNQAIDLN